MVVGMMVLEAEVRFNKRFCGSGDEMGEGVSGDMLKMRSESADGDIDADR